METMIQTPEFDRLAFTVLAIEASAQKMNTLLKRNPFHCQLL